MHFLFMLTERVLSGMKFLFDMILMTALYFGGIVALNIEWRYVLTVAGASIAGAMVLAYFRRDRHTKEMFYRSASAAICGLVSGAGLAKWFAIHAIEYTLVLYFFSALLSLFFIRALVTITEDNAGNAVILILQKILRMHDKAELKITADNEKNETEVTIKTKDGK